MRIAGWVLLLAGFVLCLSVAWAALGFLLMGIGLVSLQVAERKQRKAEKASAVAVIDARPEPATTLAEVPAAQDAPVAPEPPPLPAPETPLHADGSVYDREAWRRLVESDPDLARLAAVLADYGQHHVDEFAGSYLAKPDKSRLAAIVNEIVAKAARKESAPAAVTPPEVPQRSTPRIRTAPDATRLEPPPEHANDKIASAEDDLSELIRKFANDASFPRR
jgi:hypothetical protein